MILIPALDAHGNARMEKIPDSIGHLAELTAINLKNTSINRVPASIGSLQKLKTVVFSSMKLTSLPETFCRSLWGARWAFAFLGPLAFLDPHRSLANYI